MNDPIVTREQIAERAREAFAAGRDLNANPFPWHSAAYVTWNEEWLRQAGAQQSHARMVPFVQTQAVDLPQRGV